MSVTQSDVVSYISNLRLGEVKDLVAVLEDELGVTADVPTQPVPPPDYREIEVEQTEFDVRVTSAGPSRIQVIKAIRKATGLGLKEAKAMAEAIPTTVREALGKAEAEELAAELREAGATVEVV